MAYEFILYKKEDGAAIITMNRPEELNAWRGMMKAEMADALDDAGGDPDVWGVIFTGAGRAFGPGASTRFRTGLVPGRPGSEWADLPDRPGMWFPDDDERALLGLSHDTDRLIDRLLLFDKPSIAAINGVVAGSHISFACVCDIRIASDQARFRMAFTRVGHVPDVGLSYWLPKIVGLGHALELSYTNDFIDAKEMERIGLVNHVVPHDELIPYCKDMIKRMKQIPPSVLFATKRVMRTCVEATAKDHAEKVLYEEISRGLIQPEEREEARKSYMERRDPVYKGRGIKTRVRW